MQYWRVHQWVHTDTVVQWSWLLSAGVVCLVDRIRMEEAQHLLQFMHCVGAWPNQILDADWLIGY